MLKYTLNDRSSICEKNRKKGSREFYNIRVPLNLFDHLL